MLIQYKNSILKLFLIGAIFVAFQHDVFGAQTQTTTTIQADKPSHAISPLLWGIFFEDINWAADGGLYGELVQNRSFEYIDVFGSGFTPTTAWSLVQRGGAAASMAVSTQNPINSVNNHFISLNITKSGTGAGISNSGYSGIPVKKDEKYIFSIWARRNSGLIDSLEVKIESVNGTVYGSTKIAGITASWAKYTAEITCNSTDINARLLVLTNATCRIDLDMISLFPQKTFNNRPNGLRADLAQHLADLKPRFIRFPGGCIVHSNNIATAYRWKKTIGPLETRTTIPNRWGYLQSCGLGYFEYFQLCEDLGTEPLPVLPVGLACHFKTPYEVVPMDQMQPWVDDALDLIEYANGPVTSTWGAKRAEAGHPEPFNLKYLGVGNEEWGEEFKPRSDLFINAIRSKYPDIKIVGTAGPNVTSTDYTDLWSYNRTAKTDAVDEHYYMGVDWFKNNTHRYDSFDRNGPKVFAGEYASGTWTQNIKMLNNAIVEAAFMTGLERNSDVVLLSCYAPLFRAVHCNGKPAEQPWDPDLIYFNNNSSYCTPSYYTQMLFANNTGHILLPVDLGGAGVNGPMFYVASKDTVTKEIILKAVNISTLTITSTIKLQGVTQVQSKGVRILMTSASINDTNGFAQPQKVAPVTSTIEGVSSSFQQQFPPNSVTVLRIATKPIVAVKENFKSAEIFANEKLYINACVSSENRIKISWYFPQKSTVSARLVDYAGRNIAKVLSSKVFDSGVRSFDYVLENKKCVSNGMYVLLFTVGGRTISVPCVKY
jgi:alpha-L-arabinofuranosidase